MTLILNTQQTAQQMRLRGASNTGNALHLVLIVVLVPFLLRVIR